MRLSTRLARLEQRAVVRRTGSVKVYWENELQPCLAHRSCDIELATGEHHVGVLHLRFGGDER